MIARHGSMRDVQDTDAGDRELAIGAARAGARELTALFRTELTHHHKTALDFATSADVEAERAILAHIRASRPDDAFVGEELGSDPGSADGARTWLVDPLCGTLNFAAGTPTYCVNVALREAGRITTAAVAHPPTGEVYWAADGRFGTLGSPSADLPPTRLVAINGDGPLDRPFVGAGLAADPAFRAQFGPRIESTTLALAWVATGQRLAYVSDGELLDSVHFSAGIALCLAAGCVVTDFAGDPVHTGPGLVAARDAASHQALLELVARHR